MQENEQLQAGRIDKAQAIVDSIKNTAISIRNEMRNIPNTGKRNRDIFIKSYNRRPQNKRKKAIALAKIAITVMMGAAQLSIIKATPIRKNEFKLGSNAL